MGIAAHDLKNPITGILLATGIIRHRLQDIEKQYVLVAMEKVIGKLNDIDGIAERMLEIINKLLNVNRIESGTLTIQSVAFSVGTIVEAVVDFYAEHARPKNIVLRLENQAPDAQILADPQFVQEIIENLVSNAVKYSPTGLPIDVRLFVRGSTVRFEVQDYGPGLNGDDKKRLFGKFARLTARPTAGEHSTGLGLSIVKKLTEAMNGDVWCESELGKGATFIVELPAV
jgi:signal transduction histidine kinase